jgi:hypothetical protein
MNPDKSRDSMHSGERGLSLTCAFEERLVKAKDRLQQGDGGRAGDCRKCASDD